MLKELHYKAHISIIYLDIGLVIGVDLERTSVVKKINFSITDYCVG